MDKELEMKDIIPFYKKSANILLNPFSASDGMAIIITENDIKIEAARDITFHRGACQRIFNKLGIEKDLSQINDDFGNVITEEYGFIFIRMSSVFGYTIVYSHSQCNEYQIKKLQEFNETVKLFNNRSRRKVFFAYNGHNDYKENLDELIEELKESYKKTR